MTCINGYKPVGLPSDYEPTTLEHVKPQPKDSYLANAHPFLNGLTDIAEVVVSIPFALLFGMQGCSDRGSQLLNTGEKATGDVAGDAAWDSGSMFETKGDSGPTADTEFDAGSDLENDVCDDFCAADSILDDADAMPIDVSETTEDVMLPDSATMTDAEDAVDTANDATSATGDALDIVADATPSTDDAVALPNDSSGDVGGAEDATSVAEDAVADVENDTGAICQYQWQCPENDVGMSTDVTQSDAGAPVGAVNSNLCGSIGGALSLVAPINSPIVACTNSTINALIGNGKSCVAECAFFDGAGITLSTNPNDLDLLAPTFFDKNWNPKAEVVLTLNAPILSDGSAIPQPDSMGIKYKFSYNFAQSFASGDSVWTAKDQDANGNPMNGKITLQYQWANMISKNPGALDITFEGPSITGKAQYHYPCSTLVDEQGVPNSIIQCTEVK